jgi:FAD/FMN-containing dehydrogenase
VQPQVSRAAYVNFLDTDDGADRVRAAYGENYDRLVALKRKYDPKNFFRMNQNVRPD